MSVLYLDGFDHYTNTNGSGNHIYDRDTKWLAPATTANNHASFGTMPVLGTLALTCQQALGSGALASMNSATGLPLSTAILSGDTLGIGFHFYTAALPSTDTISGILAFGSGITSFTKTLSLSSGGVMHFKTGGVDGTSLGNSGGNVLSAATLYHIEVRFVFHATTGSVTVRVNGQAFMSLTNINTMPTLANYILFVPSYTTVSVPLTNLVYFDDLYLWNSAGSINNTFIGERVILTHFPNADTADADWTLSTGTDGFALLNDVPPVTGTDYVESSSGADSSIFGLSNLVNSSVAVSAVQTNVLAQKTTAGLGEISFGIVSNGIDALSSSTPLSQSQFRYFTSVTELDPNTGTFFLPGAINALQVKLLRSL